MNLTEEQRAYIFSQVNPATGRNFASGDKLKPADAERILTGFTPAAKQAADTAQAQDMLGSMSVATPNAAAATQPQQSTAGYATDFTEFNPPSAIDAVVQEVDQRAAMEQPAPQATEPAQPTGLDMNRILGALNSHQAEINKITPLREARFLPKEDGKRLRTIEGQLHNNYIASAQDLSAYGIQDENTFNALAVEPFEVRMGAAKIVEGQMTRGEDPGWLAAVAQVKKANAAGVSAGADAPKDVRLGADAIKKYGDIYGVENPTYKRLVAVSENKTTEEIDRELSMEPGRVFQMAQTIEPLSARARDGDIDAASGITPLFDNVEGAYNWSIKARAGGDEGVDFPGVVPITISGPGSLTSEENFKRVQEAYKNNSLVLERTADDKGNTTVKMVDPRAKPQGSSETVMNVYARQFALGSGEEVEIPKDKRYQAVLDDPQSSIKDKVEASKALSKIKTSEEDNRKRAEKQNPTNELSRLETEYKSLQSSVYEYGRAPISRGENPAMRRGARQIQRQKGIDDKIFEDAKVELAEIERQINELKSRK